MRLKQVIKNTLKKIYFGCFTVKNIPKINRLNKWIPSALIHFSLMDSHPKTAEDYFACNDSTPFTDLAPIDSADSDGTYSKALHYAFSNPQIKNIALSGPYGSGKSSIIKTYEKKSSLNFLNISLASFKEDDGNSETEFIERSILQQMLYGADANKLPHSRFKRISTPELPLLKSGIIILWLILSIFLYYYRNEWVVLESYSSCWWNLILAFVISLPIVLLSDFYKASFGLSLKKFSLKNAEIETADIPDDSILNRHLDEIIYFFQVTDYDVVVIEDLDRFGNPEIFVKLREINKIINDNNKNHNQVKFLYALKDDMFAQNNRAKFFDFIIPVVPVINRSNSLDKILEHLHEHDFAKSIDSQFLREVSLYIDDLRLIRNIFNEFTIYYERLKSESLDATKLLAMMIYKNVYPDDFENLHHGQGILFEICQEKNEYLRKSKDQLKDKINETRISIESANDEQARDIRGLIETYIGHIVMSVNEPVSGFFFDNKRYVSFSQLATFEKFKPLLVENNIMLSKLPNNHHQNRVPTNKPFSQFEEEINPGETFLSRKENIENNSESQKNELQQKIKRLKEDVLGLAQIQFFQLIQNCAIDFEKLFEKYKITDGNLLIYLVKNGFLDDNYHLYISNFHEGRLTKNDRDYILTIRNFNQDNPNQKIDTPEEVCANIREEDFGQKYVLNVTLIDYLLEHKEINTNRLKSAMHYISHNFEQSEDFFTAYFITGKHNAELIRYLSGEWPGFASAAISSQHGAEQIAYILKFVEAEYVCENMNTENLLTNYLSEKGHHVLASDLPLPDNYNVLKRLNVRFHDLLSLEKNHALLEFVHKECLYIITVENVHYVLQAFTDAKDVGNIKAEKANYTSILAVGSEQLKKYIEENLAYYLEEVFLSLPDNSEESETAIKILLNQEKLKSDHKTKIISKQNYIFENFEGIPENLWFHLLQKEKVAISWKNISEYLGYKDNDKSVVTSLLGRQNVIDTLSKLEFSITELGKDNSSILSYFIIQNDELKNTDYCQLIKCLPYSYTNFPKSISEEKQVCLARERKVRLTEDSFRFLEKNNQLVAILISKNFDTYQKDKKKYPIDDDIRELLLSSKINNKDKLTVCLDVTPNGAVENKHLSLLVANFLLSNEVDCSQFDDTVLSSAIINAQTSSDSIQLLMKCLLTWDEKKTMEVLAELPEPFSEISSYGKRPKIDKNQINLKFARLLKTKGFISSLREGKNSLKINTFKSSIHA